VTVLDEHTGGRLIPDMIAGYVLGKAPAHGGGAPWAETMWRRHGAYLPRRIAEYHQEHVAAGSP
jgi:hypothetical protein